MRYALAALAIVAAFFLSGAFKPEPETELYPLTVAPNETLWEIAERHYKDQPKSDIREFIFDIKQASGLKDSNIHAGQVIYIPLNKEAK